MAYWSGKPRFRFPVLCCPRGGATDPATNSKGTKDMKSGIHPEYVTTEVTCGCGNAFTTRSTQTSGAIHVEVCSNCHPFYTGKQKILDTGGRVARFEARYANFQAKRGK